MQETEQTDINELFSRDPMSLSDQDIDKIIAEYRKRRASFNANPAAAAAKPATRAMTAKEKSVSGLKIEGFEL